VKFALLHVRMLFAALALGLAGCVSVETRTPAAHDREASAPARTAICDRLYFGRAIPGGGEVSEAQWHAFVATEIAPRFPNGFTTYRTAGHWRGDGGAAVSEQTMIVEIVHDAYDTAADRALDEIARAYRARFSQDAVMRVRTPAEQTFLRR
jgi:hypothetical protein